MTFRELWMPARVAFEGEGAGGAGGGADTQAGGDTLAGGAGGDAPKWWESDSFKDDQRQYLRAKGLTVDDPNEAIQKLVGIGQNADKRFGKPLDSVMDRPKEGQKLLDWQRENAEMFGLPKTIEEVKIERPKEMKEGIAWDGELESQARQAAYDLGLSNAQLQGMTELYASRVEAMAKAADAEAETANTRMMEAIQKDWGAETDAKVARARQAAGVVAEAAGLDAAGIEAVSQALSLKTGDAATIRLFAALGDMLAEDKLVGGGGNKIGTTPAEARAEAAALRAPDGAYSKAVGANDQRELARLKPIMDRLDRIAAGGKA